MYFGCRARLAEVKLGWQDREWRGKERGKGRMRKVDMQKCENAERESSDEAEEAQYALRRRDFSC